MRRLLPLAASLLVFAADQATKAWLAATLPFGGERPFGRWFTLVHWHNRGGLFGLMDDLPEGGRIALFLLVPLVGVALLGSLYLKSRRPLERWLLAAVLGGAAGNLLDRLRFGAVVDFLYFHLPGGPGWPAFNVADAVLSTGIALFVFLTFTTSPKEAGGASDPLSHR